MSLWKCNLTHKLLIAYFLEYIIDRFRWQVIELQKDIRSFLLSPMKTSDNHGFLLFFQVFIDVPENWFS